MRWRRLRSTSVGPWWRSSTTARRSTPAMRSTSSPRSTSGERSSACARPTASGQWRAWKVDSVAPGDALRLLVERALLPADRSSLDAVLLAGREDHVPRPDLRLADDPRRRLRHRLAAERRVRVLLVLVTELDALRAAVELGAGETNREVAPVVLRQRARRVVRARRNREAPGVDHGGTGLQDPPIPGRRARLD